MGTPSPATTPWPRVVFGTSALGNLYQALPDERKLAIVASWFEGSDAHVVIDTAGKYGAGLALESIGDCLRELGIPPERVTIGNKLAWYRVPLTAPEPSFEPGAWIGLQNDAEQRISGEGILQCRAQGDELLGAPYRSSMASVHDPDEYLAAAKDPADKQRRREDILEAYAKLRELRDKGEVESVGVGSKDWRVVREIANTVALDWVMLANCVTALTHESGALRFIAALAEQGVKVINSGVFNAGFLVGGEFFDYRLITPESDPDLFAWRETFNAVCAKQGVKPAHACIQFGLSPPGVGSVALSSTNPDRVRANVEMANTPLPAEFWDAVKTAGLISASYPHLGSPA